VRYLSDGNIENLGRFDYQVKVRGFRVELGEIEAALSEHEAIRECVLTARQGNGADKQLVAYAVCNAEQPPSVSELRAHLKERLPDYMVPSFFVFMDAMPLSPNGKVNRLALPAPDQSRPELLQEYVAPRTPLESELAGVWGQVLSLENIGVNDNFFELGGHSLLATQLVSRIRDAFGVELPLRQIFELPTVAQQAERIQTSMQAEQEGIEDLSEILESLEGLSDEDVKALLADKLGDSTANLA
jgi:surfactin family lipopeptide synthetase A